ncbi:hypothetical protein, conserved [Plasmodium vivax]|uniref:C2H2-type domain-containing protein n=1 Tax=Plasmodium vivax (strain Salvador I) TaxID=126793 RepID=A5KAR2_PLAVS|nr:hypothetical protein, conserved [Plasmodium vivax]EDL43661.1 hypothetical protein, conserved [Plasmodium vivax]|eukprot:XP_001613388.1 hypothetical protein [Plasmodium vivax Sal-1]
MDRVLLKYIFDELCTSFNKKEKTSYSKKKEDSDDNSQNQVNYCITLQELFENLERNKNVHMDVHMKREVLRVLYYCKDVSMSQQGKNAAAPEQLGKPRANSCRAHLDQYNNSVESPLEEDPNSLLNAATEISLYINNIYIYNKHNLFYYERIKECKEKILILLYIVSGKYDGLIQSSLAKYLNMDVKMVHYHLKVLFQYLLIKKISINISSMEKTLDYSNHNAHSNSSSSNTIKLNPSYILYFNIYFIYNLLPIFIKNVLYSQNVLSINKIILHLLKRFIIIPQKILSLIFFKLLIVYNPYYYIQIKKALKIFNSILSHLICKKKIIMCKIKIHSSYENCYLNYENKDKINYDNIINFLILFYYNYDYLIKFINKSCYLMCEDYVQKIEFKNEFFRSNVTKESAWDQLGMHLKRGDTSTQSAQHHSERGALHGKVEHSKGHTIGSTPCRQTDNSAPDGDPPPMSRVHPNESAVDAPQRDIPLGEEENIFMNEKNCNLQINEFKNYMDLNIHDRLNDTDYYSSSHNGKEESSESEFSFLYGNKKADDLPKQTEEINKPIEDGNKKSSSSQSSASSTFDSDSDNNAYTNHSGRNKNLLLNHLSLYNKIKYLIMSKGISGMTTKEISQVLLMSIKKTNTFLSKLVRNKEVVKIPERKDKSFMYRFIDNYMYQYVQKRPRALAGKANQTLQGVIKSDEVAPGEEITVDDQSLKGNRNVLPTDQMMSGSPDQNGSAPPTDNLTVSTIQPTEKPNRYNTTQENFSHIQFNKLNESLNVLNYINTVNEIDMNVLTYIIPKQKDSVDSFANYKDFFDHYVKNFKTFEDKYDLYTCSFHFFYYLKFVLKRDISNSTPRCSSAEVRKQKSQTATLKESTNDETFAMCQDDPTLNKVDSSEKDIDFIKYFMEDTTKLKSNLFIKRLFIFCHFLLSSKVTTFRYLQDLFITIENNGRTIDRKSVQRLFNYSTKINAFFKKYTLLNSKTVKYYFYDSNALSEKQSNDLYAKIQQDYAISSYKHANPNDKTNKEKTEYYNISSGNIISKKFKYTVNIFNDKAKGITDSAQQGGIPTKDDSNVTAQMHSNEADGAYFSSNREKALEEDFIDLTEYPENGPHRGVSSYNFSAPCEDPNMWPITLYNGEANINAPNDNLHGTKDRCNQTGSNLSSPIPNNSMISSFTPVEVANRSSKRKMATPPTQSLSKRGKMEQSHQFYAIENKLPSGENGKATPYHFSKSGINSTLNDKNEISRGRHPLGETQTNNPSGQPNRNNNAATSLSQNGTACNVLYIDILNESAFKCKENQIISKKIKTSKVFQNFKTTQEFSYSINYFNGYIFSKMTRYKYFHKCLIRILKGKKRKRKRARQTRTAEKENECDTQAVLTPNPDNPKKRKLSYIEEAKRKSSPKKAHKEPHKASHKSPPNRSSNALTVKDILKNLYLDEYLKIISVGCKLNYIENYLLQEKRKKRMKDLPPILFEFLTSYSSLNCSKQRMIESFLLNKNDHSHFPNSSTSSFVIKGKTESHMTSPPLYTTEAEKPTHSATTNGEQKSTRAADKPDEKPNSDHLCQHDINIIKSSDKICVFFFLYRKLKFLCNMNLVKLKFEDMNKNIPHKWKPSVGSNQKNRELNLSFLDLKKNNLQIIIRQNVSIHLFSSKKGKKKLPIYNMLRYNHFEEYYYNLYLIVERFKKFLVEGHLQKNASEKLTLQDILKSSKIKNKGLKSLLLHNAYTNQLFLTRKLRNLFISLVKEVKKKNISNSKLAENLTTYREYNTFRESYNVSRSNIEKYFSIFYDWYSKEKNGGATMTEKDLSFSCPFCNNVYFFKNDLLSHISNVHNVNRNFSDLISFFSNSKQMIHKKLSDFLKIKNRVKENSSGFSPYNFGSHLSNLNLAIASRGRNAIGIGESHSLHYTGQTANICGPQIGAPYDAFKKQLEKGPQMNHPRRAVTSSKEIELPHQESTHMKRKHTEMAAKRDRANGTHYEKHANLPLSICKKGNSKHLNNFIEKVKVKYSLRIVYIYFVTVIVKLAMSQKCLEKEKKKRERQNEQFPLDKPLPNGENNSPSGWTLPINDNDEMDRNTPRDIPNGGEVTGARSSNERKKLHAKKNKLMKERRKKGRLPSGVTTTHPSRHHKGNELKRRNRQSVEVVPSPSETPNHLNNFASIQLRKFHVIYHLKNRTNSEPYRKSIWIKANNMMVGKFKQNVCMYIQKKLFLYFKKNIVHYFFILSNENLARCILNYFATHIYNCTYTNINYYYDKYIKNIFHFKFISLVNLLKIFIINYGDQYALYREITKPLYFQKMKDIKNALRFIKKKNYVVDTSYVLSYYIANDLVCDNVYSYLIYKSIFYKKKLSLSLKKSFLDNVVDVIYLYGIYHSKKNAESAQADALHRKENIPNCHLGELLYHIDAVYDDEDGINGLDAHFEKFPSSATPQNGYKHANFDAQPNRHPLLNGLNSHTYDQGECPVRSHDSNDAMQSDNLTNGSSNGECTKHYFQKKLTIFDLNYYVHNFLKGEMILCACNNYILADEEGHTGGGDPIGGDHYEADDSYHFGNFEGDHYADDHYADDHYAEDPYVGNPYGDDSYPDEGDSSQRGSQLSDIEKETHPRGTEKKCKRKNHAQKSKRTRKKRTSNSTSHSFKGKRGNKPNGEDYPSGCYKEEEKAMSYTSSSANDSDIFDNLSDDFEIIKLLENANDGRKKVLGGITKHIKCLTKHVSEYFPNYYILNHCEKKKIEKRLSQIFSTGKDKNCSKLNNSLRWLYHHTGQQNNSLFTYFKKYCLHIYENHIRGTVPTSQFKNSLLLNVNDTNRVNFANLFWKYVQQNNFHNSIIYSKNKLLIYNVSKKSFIDFDWYPQNIHLYNIAYISNAPKRVDSLLDVQVTNLKNSVYWLERDNHKRPKLGNKKRSAHSASLMTNEGQPFEQRYQQKGPEIAPTGGYPKQGKETPAKSPHRCNARKNPFVKKVKVKKGKAKKVNTLKESFIFVTQILYHVFYLSDMLKAYDECADCEGDASEKKQRKIPPSGRLNEMYRGHDNDIAKHHGVMGEGPSSCADSAKCRSDTANREPGEADEEEGPLDDRPIEPPTELPTELPNELPKGDREEHYNLNKFKPNELRVIRMAGRLNGQKAKKRNAAQKEAAHMEIPSKDKTNAQKSPSLFNKIIRKMIFILLTVKKKKKEGRFMDSLKKMYLQEFLKNTTYGKYTQVKKEYDFILFLLHKLNLINIFPLMNTHKIFLPKYHSENNACKRKNVFYEHNVKYPFLNMINIHLANFKLDFKKITERDAEIFEKFLLQRGVLPNGALQIRREKMQNCQKKDTHAVNVEEKYVGKKNVGEKVIYKGRKLAYTDYIYINYTNNNTLRKPNFIPRLILLFNLPCHIIIHDYFFLYLLEYFCKMKESLGEETQSGFKENHIYRTKLGDKLLYLIENKSYPRVIRYIKSIINKACKYFEHMLFSYKRKNDSPFCKSVTLYYFNDDYINVNSFTYMNGSTNVKFIFFYILKVFFYLKANPFSSIFDIYKSIEILSFCDLNFLLRGMCQDNFISFKLMYVSKRSEMYKLNKNYKIVNQFDNLVLNEKKKKKKKKKKKNRALSSLAPPPGKKRACYIFGNSTSSGEALSTDDYDDDDDDDDDDILKKGKRRKKGTDRANSTNRSSWTTPQRMSGAKGANFTLKRGRYCAPANYDAFLEKMMYKKVKLYYVADEGVIFEKYAGTLWG